AAATNQEQQEHGNRPGSAAGAANGSHGSRPYPTGRELSTSALVNCNESPCAERGSSATVWARVKERVVGRTGRLRWPAHRACGRGWLHGKCTAPRLPPVR